jgi:hypothetical protein
MKTIIKLNLLITIFLLSNCIEKEGYYDHNQENIISNLTENKWERKYHDQLDNGVEMDIHEIYTFSENGSGSFQVRDYPSDCVNRKLRDFSRSFLYIDFVKNQILWTFLKNF